MARLLFHSHLVHWPQPAHQLGCCLAPCHACLVCGAHWANVASSVCAFTAVSSLAVRACLAASVWPGISVLVPRLARWGTLAVRADARDAIYISISSREAHCSVLLDRADAGAARASPGKS